MFPLPSLLQIGFDDEDATFVESVLNLASDWCSIHPLGNESASLNVVPSKIMFSLLAAKLQSFEEVIFLNIGLS